MAHEQSEEHTDADILEVNEAIESVTDDVTAKQAALNLLRWAKDRHVLATPGLEEAADVVEDEADPVPQKAFSSAKVTDILKRRSINMIAFNDHQNKVVVFTKGRVTHNEEKTLPSVGRGGVIYEYVSGGVAQVKGTPPSSPGRKPYYEHNNAYCCGSSIFPANCIGAGTLGLLARSENGIIYGVSNNHVAGACNHAPPGLPILAPGPVDISSDHRNPFTIGRHTKLEPINDGIPENVDISVNWDVCCFEIANPALVSSMQGNSYDTPSMVADPAGGTIVEKVGRTTGHTVGRLLGQSVSPIPVAYNVAEYGIKKSVFFETVYVVQGSDGKPFSKGGDSGSLVTCVQGHERVAIGLVFAGDEARGLSFILPLTPMLQKLELTIVGAHNV